MGDDEAPRTPGRSVILVGAARSGTKLLRDAIASHPGVAKVPYDINYVWRLGNEGVPHDELPADLATPAVRRRIRKRIESYRRGRAVLVEKTVATTLRVPFARRIYPDAHFVHLVRHGGDVTESAVRQWRAPPDWRYIVKKARGFPIVEALGYAAGYAKSTLRRVLRPRRPVVWGPRYDGIEEDLARWSLAEVCAMQWRTCVEHALEALAEVPPPQVTTIRYEEFVEDPIAHLRTLASRIGIDPVGYEESDVAARISVDYIGRGRRADDREIESAITLLEPTLARLGYH